MNQRPNQDESGTDKRRQHRRSKGEKREWKTELTIVSLSLLSEHVDEALVEESMATRWKAILGLQRGLPLRITNHVLRELLHLNRHRHIPDLSRLRQAIAAKQSDSESAGEEAVERWTAAAAPLDSSGPVETSQLLNMEIDLSKELTALSRSISEEVNGSLTQNPSSCIQLELISMLVVFFMSPQPVFRIPAAIPFIVRIRVSSSPGAYSLFGLSITSSEAGSPLDSVVSSADLFLGLTSTW
ncbi:hypothetical protein SAY87_017600 [Trapa incisa]|uniref:Uncharacterized protein n=1 Tax=Trapa incisa TaxID=236973 RepID=A0AAN7L6T6_9MYRT|nr:hypothetical protein SAY87_017600 [Trapa incisa]